MDYLCRLTSCRTEEGFSSHRLLLSRSKNTYAEVAGDAGEAGKTGIGNLLAGRKGVILKSFTRIVPRLVLVNVLVLSILCEFLL